jgi:hypothetical protein
MIAFLSFPFLIKYFNCSEYVIVDGVETGIYYIQNYEEFNYPSNESSTILLHGETNNQDVSVNTPHFETNQNAFSSNNIVTTDNNQSTFVNELEEFLIFRGSIGYSKNHDYNDGSDVVTISKTSFNITNFNVFFKELNDLIYSYIITNLKESDNGAYIKRIKLWKL